MKLSKVSPVVRCVVFFHVIYSVSYAAAQIRMPDESPLPAVVNRSSHEAGVIAAGVTVINLYDRYKPREQPSQEAKEIPENALEFLGQYVVAALDNTSAPRWALLVRLESNALTVAQYFGWVPVKYLTTGIALRDPVTTVYKKAFLRPHLAGEVRRTEETSGTRPGRSDTDSKGRGNDLAETARKAPSNQAEPLISVRFFQFFFIFAETGDNPERDWVFLCSEYQIDVSDPSRNARIIGWIPLKSVEIWLTREAVQWNTSPERELTPGIIWRTPEAAIEAGPGEMGREEDILFRERFLDEKPIPLKPDLPRYPIMPWEEEEKYRERIRRFPGWKLKKVLVPGGFIDSNGNPIATADEIVQLQRKLQWLEEQVSHLEVVFVIDDTESMRPWFSVVANAVEKIVQTVKSQPGLSLKLGVTFYDDYDNSLLLRRDPFECFPLTQDVETIVSLIRNRKVSRGGDPEECVFEGIAAAITRSGFSPHATKLLIVIGDDADKSYKHPGQGITESDIANLLCKFPVPIAFAAIQAYPESQLSQRPVAMAFRDQMKAIRERYMKTITNPPNPRHAPQNAFTIPPTVVTSSQPNEITHAILNHFTELNVYQKKCMDDIQRLRIGDFSAEVAPGVEALLKELRSDPELLKRLRAATGAQVCWPGYVWMPNLASGSEAKGTAEYVLLLTSREVDDSIYAIRRFFGELGSGQWGQHNLTTLLEKALGEQVKEDFENLILKKTALEGAGRFVNALLEKRATENDLVQLRLRMLKLHDMLNDTERTYVVETDSDGIHFKVVGPPRYESRGFKSFTGETTFYWVRVRDEWP